MKNLLQFDGVITQFFEPYYIYDIVTVYDKSKHVYVTKRRASAISYSEVGEIIISTTICSEQDSFNKKQARTILLNRLSLTIKEVTSLNFIPCNIYSINESHYFADDDSFLSYCDLFDSHARLYFTPYKIDTIARTSDSAFVDSKGVTRVKTTSYPSLLDTMRSSPSQSYLHKEFVIASYNKFMNVIYDHNSKSNSFRILYKNDSAPPNIDVYDNGSSTSPCSPECDVD